MFLNKVSKIAITFAVIGGLFCAGCTYNKYENFLRKTTFPDTLNYEFYLTLRSRTNAEIQKHIIIRGGKLVEIPGLNTKIIIRRFIENFAIDKKTKKIIKSKNSKKNPAIFISFIQNKRIVYQSWFFKDIPNFGNWEKRQIYITFDNYKKISNKKPLKYYN